MSVLLSNDEKLAHSNWFYALRMRIIQSIEKIEADYHDLYEKHQQNSHFTITKWNRDGGGGGEMGVIRGNVFEKMGVNVSSVWGELSPDFSKQLPGTENSRHFWASGLSLVAHPRSPFVPPIHMNVRCISTGNAAWVAGGIDLNPILPGAAETAEFHGKLRVMCNKHNPDYYEKFAKWCDEYFWLPHRKEHRGVGGVFFDYLAMENLDFVREIGDNFIPIYDEIVRKKVEKTWSESDKKHQLFRRGRYAEFNLLYDRGIKFGLMTNGNADSMMMSLPPLVSWE